MTNLSYNSRFHGDSVLRLMIHICSLFDKYTGLSKCNASYLFPCKLQQYYEHNNNIWQSAYSAIKQFFNSVTTTFISSLKAWEKDDILKNWENCLDRKKQLCWTSNKLLGIDACNTKLCWTSLAYTAETHLPVFHCITKQSLWRDAKLD